MPYKDKTTGEWLDNGREATIRITVELSARQDVEFRTMDLVMAMSKSLDAQFGEALDYNFVIDD